MKNRISTSVLIFKNNKILLIKHVHPKTGFTWWVPPGGGLHEKETIFEAAQREVREEAGLKVKPHKIAYVRQYIDYEFGRNNIVLYLTTRLTKGKETIKNIKGKGLDDKYIKDLGYFSKKELKNMTVFPEIIKKGMWEDCKKGFPSIKFIGVDVDKG